MTDEKLKQYKTSARRADLRERYRRFGGSILRKTNFLRWIKLARFLQKMDGIRGGYKSNAASYAIYELRFGYPPKDASATDLFVFLDNRSSWERLLEGASADVHFSSARLNDALSK